jgi:hypothetical protein
MSRRFQHHRKARKQILDEKISKEIDNLDHLDLKSRRHGAVRSENMRNSLDPKRIDSYQKKFLNLEDTPISGSGMRSTASNIPRGSTSRGGRHPSTNPISVSKTSVKNAAEKSRSNSRVTRDPFLDAYQ